MITKNLTKTQKNAIKKPFDPVSSIRKYSSLVIVISVLTFLISLAVILTSNQFKPRYSSETLINVNPYFSRILYKVEETDWIRSYENWMRTQVNVIKSYPVLEKAIKDYESNGYVWHHPGESMQSAVERLAERLDIKQIRDTQLIAISMVASSNNGLSEIINSVVSSHIDNERMRKDNEDSFKIQKLRSERQNIQKELEERYEELEEAAGKFGTAITEEKNLYVYIDSLNDLRSSYNKILVARINLKNKIVALKNKKQDIAGLDITALANYMVEKNSVLNDNLIQLNRREQQIIEQMVGLKDQHPRYIYLQKKINELRDQTQRLSDTIKQQQNDIIKDKMLTDNEIEIKDIKAEYETLHSTETEMQSELEKIQNDILEFNTAVLRASTKRQEISRLQDSLNRINERIDQIKIESASPGRMSVQSWALKPESPSVDTRPKFLAIGLIGSLILGLALAVTLGFLDNTVHKPEDIENVIGVPVTGYVIDVKEDNLTNKDIYTVFKTHPNSFLFNQYYQISLHLHKEHTEHGSKVFMISSLKDGNGASSLALNSLAALNSTSDRKLYIDFNYRSPLRKRFPEFKNLKLMSDWILNQEVVDEDIYSDLEFPFDILTIGDMKPDSIKNCVSNLRNVVDRLSDKYDYIFIDVPPLLLSAESMEVASFAEVVVLVPEAGSTTWADLTRGLDILDRLGTKVVSLILNKFNPLNGESVKREMNEYYGRYDLLKPATLGIWRLNNLNIFLDEIGKRFINYAINFTINTRSFFKNNIARF